jgi:hypothetical protein
MWTGALVGQWIEQRFGVHYHPQHIPRLLHQLGFSVQRILSAIDGLDRDWVLWMAGYRLAPMGGAEATWSRSAQQRWNFLPEPQGQGAPRAAVAGRVV